MKTTVKTILSCCLLVFLWNAQALAQASETYYCSIYIAKQLSKFEYYNVPGKKNLPLVDIRNSEVQIFKVAQDESDWHAYTEVFQGLSRTLEEIVVEKTFQRFYFTARLIPNTYSGNQELDIELSIQTFNKLEESKMKPVAIDRSNKNNRVATQYTSANGHIVSLSCSQKPEPIGQGRSLQYD